VYPGKCGSFNSVLPENFEAVRVKDSVDFVMGRVVYLIKIGYVGFEVFTAFFKIGYVFMLLLFKSLGIQFLSNWTGPISDNYKNVRRADEHHDLLYDL
jgi:hypothetical protein